MLQVVKREKLATKVVKYRNTYAPAKLSEVIAAMEKGLGWFRMYIPRDAAPILKELQKHVGADATVTLITEPGSGSFGGSFYIQFDQPLPKLDGELGSYSYFTKKTELVIFY